MQAACFLYKQMKPSKSLQDMYISQIAKIFIKGFSDVLMLMFNTSVFISEQMIDQLKPSGSYFIDEQQTVIVMKLKTAMSDSVNCLS